MSLKIDKVPLSHGSSSNAASPGYDVGFRSNLSVEKTDSSIERQTLLTFAARTVDGPGQSTTVFLVLAFDRTAHKFLNMRFGSFAWSRLCLELSFFG